MRNRRTELEPTRRDLRAIESEWPVIAAGLASLDAEIAAAMRGDELGARRARRAMARRASSFTAVPDGAA